MLGYLPFISDIFHIFWMERHYQWLFYIALIIIFLKDKDSMSRHALLWYPLFTYAFIISPIFLYVGRLAWGDDSTAYTCRQFSLVPIFYTIAYAGVLLIKNKQTHKKFCGFVLLSIIFCITGSPFIYTHAEHRFEKSENFYKLSGDMMKICDYMDSVDSDPRVVLDFNLSYQIRQYDASVIQLTGYQDPDFFSTELGKESPDLASLMQSACANGADFIIIRNTPEIMEHFQTLGYLPCYKTDGYLLYECFGYDGYHVEYGDHKQILSISYYDAEGNPRLCELGYAFVEFERDPYGNIINEYYYDENKEPITLKL